MEKMEKTQTDSMFAFEDLLVWQKAINFVETVIKTIDLFEAPRLIHCSRISFRDYQFTNSNSQTAMD
jgi:hypothetical protein